MNGRNVMNKIILDASVALKWFFKETNSLEAINLMGDIQGGSLSVIVPPSFYIECANALWEKTRRKMFGFEDAHDAMKDIRELPLQGHLHESLEDVAYDHACAYDITVYDALYVSLAEIYGAPLVTADDKLIKACKGKFNFIEHLKDFKI